MLCQLVNRYQHFKQMSVAVYKPTQLNNPADLSRQQTWCQTFKSQDISVQLFTNKQIPILLGDNVTTHETREVFCLLTMYLLRLRSVRATKMKYEYGTLLEDTDRGWPTYSEKKMS
jgi:hypothetical protein